MAKIKYDTKDANTKLYKETAARCGVSPKQVEECVTIIGKFITDMAKKGAFETVMIPKFGKFRVKTKKLQWVNYTKVMPDLLKGVKPDEDFDLEND